jgi:hypothetical protein
VAAKLGSFSTSAARRCEAFALAFDIAGLDSALNGLGFGLAFAPSRSY